MSVINRDGEFRPRPDPQYTRVAPYSRVDAVLEVKAQVHVMFENSPSSVVAYVGKVKVAER